MPRVKQLSRQEAPAEIVALYDEIFGPGRDPVSQPGTATGTPGNWWTTWSQAPAVLKALRSYGYRNAPIDPKLREMAIVRAGWDKQSQFVYSQHCKSARREGVSEAKLRAIPYWTVSDQFSPEERAVLAYVDGLMLEGGRVHDEVFAALKRVFSDEQVLVLTYLVNSYGMHATACKALRMEYDDVPERVVEIPPPDGGGVQDWRDPKWAAAPAREKA